MGLPSCPASAPLVRVTSLGATTWYTANGAGGLNRWMLVTSTVHVAVVVVVVDEAMAPQRQQGRTRKVDRKATGSRVDSRDFLSRFTDQNLFVGWPKTMSQRWPSHNWCIGFAKTLAHTHTHWHPICHLHTPTGCHCRPTTRLRRKVEEPRNRKTEHSSHHTEMVRTVRWNKR